MNRQEAQQLVGKTVYVWTGMNGEYVGILKELDTPKGRPWRGIVEITGVARTACPFEIMRTVQRKGFRIGRTLNVGGSSIKEGGKELVGRTYLEALRYDLESWKNTTETVRNQGIVARSIEELQDRIAEESAPGGVLIVEDGDRCEVSFREIPETAVRDALKEAGYHFNMGKWTGKVHLLPALVKDLATSA